MKYKFYVFLGLVVLTLVAAGLTQAALLLGRSGQIADDVLHRPTVSASPRSAPATPKPSATPTPTVTPSPAVTPTTPTATPRPAGTAVTNSFVRLRADATTTSAVVTELQAGTIVTLGTYRDGSWQQVTVNGLNGYVYRAYLTY